MRSQPLANAETHFPLAQAAKAGTIHCRSFGIWPGLLLTGSISAFAFALRQIPGLSTFSPMILAIVIGIGLHNLTLLALPHKQKTVSRLSCAKFCALGSSSSGCS